MKVPVNIKLSPNPKDELPETESVATSNHLQGKYKSCTSNNRA